MNKTMDAYLPNAQKEVVLVAEWFLFAASIHKISVSSFEGLNLLLSVYKELPSLEDRTVFVLKTSLLFYSILHDSYLMFFFLINHIKSKFYAFSPSRPIYIQTVHIWFIFSSTPSNFMDGAMQMKN